MTKHRLIAGLLLLIMVGLGYGIYQSGLDGTNLSKRFPFVFGLDLAGGTGLTYKADVSEIDSADVSPAMETLRDVIERRVNLFGVSEPLVQVQKGGVGSEAQNKLIVELSGITNVDEAIKLIGQTPNLEFRLFSSTTAETLSYKTSDSTGLTGRYINRATLEFIPNSREAIVGLTFNSDGAKLFASITKNNIGVPLAIFLDGEAISAPVIRDEISDGRAQISGGFTIPQARDLVRNLNYGALPVPIELISTQSVGASLGQQALNSTVFAGIVGFIVVAIFLIIWYRLPGLLATVSLAMYVILSLVVFKLLPVTLTAAGLAGFILSIGMAVDANILIFERMREELKNGLSFTDAIKEGFARAWLSIRDSNFSSIITALVLYYVSSTAVVKGFALVFGLGVLISMFTAITVSRTFLLALGTIPSNKLTRFLFGSGLRGSINSN